MTMAALTDDGEAEGAAPHEATYRRRGPGPWDVHVGQRIKEARTIRGLSQQALGKTASISFQQVQKYENGSSRIAASRLVSFARALDVPMGAFFEGIGDVGDAAEARALESMLTTEVAQDLVRHFDSVREPALRRRITDLVACIASDRAAVS